MVGQNIGKYRVLDRIGRGGMGTVYRAIDETLHREVAIKVLNAELNDPEVAKRFRAEAITVARLSHPGIATIYELFQHEGQWLMVMEFVPGETLEHMAERVSTLSPQHAAEICMQCLAALAHAHSMGVVHRDLKPANLMITRTGAIKVMDFGIARVAGTEHLTSAGYMMGTPAYMAPEQVTGQEIDTRADLYALGVVFYRLTAGRLPFKGDTPFAMAQSQVNDPPTPIGTVRSDLPSWVEQVVVRALAKLPEERFQTSLEFHGALERCLSGLPMTAPYSSSAPTELLMTPSRALPTGGISRPLTSPRLPTLPPASTAMPTPAGSDETPALGTPLPATSGRIPKPATAHVSPPAAAGAGTTRPGSSPLIPLIAAGLVVLLASAGGLWWWRSRQQAAATTDVTTTPADSAVPGAPVDPSAPMTPATGETPPPVTPPAGTVAAAPPPAGTSTGSTTSTPAGSRSTPPAGQPTGRGDAASAARGAGTGTGLSAGAAATGGAAGTTAAAPGRGPIDDTQQVFTRSHVLIVNGKRTNDEEIVLTFGGGQVSLIGPRGGSAIATVPYSSILHATYARARDPKWSPAYFSPPAGLDVGSFIRTTKNWLVLQMKDTFLILKLDDSNVSRVLQAIEGRTGLTIDRPRVDDKDK